MEFVAFSEHRLVKWTLNIRKLDIIMRTIKSRKWKALKNDTFCTEVTELLSDSVAAPAHAAAVGAVKELTAF